MLKILSLAFVFYLFFPLLMHAQSDSVAFFLRFTGGYADVGSSNGVSSLGAVAGNTRSWNAGLTMGFSLSKHWEAGFGFEYQKQKSETESRLFVPKQLMGLQLTQTDINLVIGRAYLAGCWHLFSRLYFNPILSVGVGKATGTQTNLTATTNIQADDSFVHITEPKDYLGGGETDISYKYFAVGIAPAFTFYLNRHLALNLETGNFQFSTTDWKWENKQWLANVNPAYWKLGIIWTTKFY